MNTYGVLLIGGKGTHQPTHAKIFASDPRCHVVAVTDELSVSGRRLKLNQQLAEEYGVPYIPDLDEALLKDDVDIISVCPEVERRGRIVPKCAAAKKHLYLDKPLANTLTDSDTIVAAVEQSGVTHQMQLTQVNSHIGQQAKQAIDSGQIGDLVTIHADQFFGKGKGGTVPEGFVRNEQEDIKRYTFLEAKAEFFDVGLYPIGLVQWLVDKPTTKVYAMTANYFFAEHVKAGIEDFGAMAMTFEGGITATITAGRVGFMSHPMNGRSRLTIVGTKGVITYDPLRPHIDVYNDEPNFVMPKIHPEDPMGMFEAPSPEYKLMPRNRFVPLHEDLTDDTTSFIDCIERGIEPIMNVRRSAAVTETILAGYISASRGQEISLPLPR